MTDPIYADVRLAPVYDGFESDRADLDPYVALADQLGARRVVDLGAGTGSLALRLAVGGREVVAVDPAAASLQIARSKPGAGRVTWIEGDATAIPDDEHADLVVMTGNAAQAVLTDQAWRATLTCVHAALAPGGCFALESRRPERRAWREWDHPEPVTVVVPGVGPVRRRLELTAVDLPLVSFRFTYCFPDGTVLRSASTIRFRSEDELRANLTDAGFEVRDVRDAPDRPGREIVVLAVRPPAAVSRAVAGGRH